MMKKINTILKATGALFVICTLIFSCKKKFDDALPKVSLQSVALKGLDSVTLTVQVTSKGASAIEYAGVSYSNYPSASIVSNQVLLQDGHTSFNITVHALHDSTYYFKAFAANSLGYSVSNVIKYTVATPPPAIAPCTLTSNYIHDNGSAFSVYAYGSATNPTYGNYQVTMNGTNEDIMMCFPAVPYNGIYSTTSDGSHLSAGQVYVSISNFNQYVINGGDNVYVSIDSLGKTTISSCALHYGTSSVMYGKVIY
jgi:hypothetical protein